MSVTGCATGAERERQRLNSANPLDRAAAVIHVTEARDAAAVPKLVDLLADPDPVVRMWAIYGLRKLCGEDYGYRHWELESLRESAVERWRAAVRAGQVVVRGG